MRGVQQCRPWTQHSDLFSGLPRYVNCTHTKDGGSWTLNCVICCWCTLHFNLRMMFADDIFTKLTGIVWWMAQMVANVIASCSSVGSTLFSVITQLLTTLRFVFTVSDGFFFCASVVSHYWWSNVETALRRMCECTYRHSIFQCV